MTEIYFPNLKTLGYPGHIGPNGKCYIFLYGNNDVDISFPFEYMYGEGMSTGPENSFIYTERYVVKFPYLKYIGGYLFCRRVNNITKKLYMPVVEECNIKMCNYIGTINQIEYILVGCKGNRTQTILLQKGHSETFDTLLDFEIGDKEYIDNGLEPRWEPCQPINISAFYSLTRENVVNHIFNRLKNNSDFTKITITIASAVYSSLTDEDRGIATDKNYTIAYK